jgi:3-oxoacyl-[acyl-carrier protein] reductase
MFDLSEKRALVTGASGGIGGAIAKSLHAAGATVALSGTRIDALQAVADDLGERAHVTPADLGSAEGAEALINDAITAMGAISWRCV